MRVLLILGHPRPDSLCAALADAYAEGAAEAGVELERLDLHRLHFEHDVLALSPHLQALEPDLRRALALLAWAEHLVFVFPTWWGTMPALQKAFLDRVLMPGFAFAHRADGHGWDKLLAGRTAQLITTMDTPPPVYRWIYGAPGLRAMARATLGFCGVRTTGKKLFGPVLGSTAGRRAAWIAEVRASGAALRFGVYRPRQRAFDAVTAWLAALRLQFHPMAWAAYTLGARAAAGSFHALAVPRFWIGLLALFALEVATVLTNERFDWESDRRNRNYSAFSGGSRVLVDGRIGRRALGAGIAVALAAYLLAAAWLMAVRPHVWPWLVLAPVLGLGYTAPPLKLCWRGLGEADVAFTHSALVIVFGYALAGGGWADPWPWLISLPLFCAVFAAITLSGLPDAEADRTAGKRTLAVRLGPRRAVQAAMLFTLGAGVLSLFAWSLALPNSSLAVLLGGAALLLGVARWRSLARLARQPPAAVRIDRQMRNALAFIMWFVIVPLAAAWGARSGW